MAFLEINDAQIYYEDFGAGDDVIIALHGLAENTAYWTLTGVAQKLAEKYRIICMDMRGHGNTVVKNNSGFDVEPIGDDVEGVADRLGIQTFHLMGHSTGGMIAVRYAMRGNRRVKSLILTSTTPATAMAESSVLNQQGNDLLAQGFEVNEWHEIVKLARKKPFPFFLGMKDLPDLEEKWNIVSEMFHRGDRKVIAAFIKRFYIDPDMKVEALRRIECPALILRGEQDLIMVPGSDTLAEEIPDAEYIVYPQRGHMLAIEDPKSMIADILAFLERQNERA